MPIMEVRYAEGALDRAQKASLAKGLTDLLIRMEGGAGTPGGRAFALVQFTCFDAGDWWAGGSTDGTYVTAPGAFHVHVSIPEGYMSQVHKNEVHAGVQRAILAATGRQDGGGSILVVIHEVPEGNWGCAGKPISIASIAASVGLSKDGERFAWVRSYFAAKAHARAASDYPADMGGLLPPGS